MREVEIGISISPEYTQVIRVTLPMLQYRECEARAEDWPGADGWLRDRALYRGPWSDWTDIPIMEE